MHLPRARLGGPAPPRRSLLLLRRLLLSDQLLGKYNEGQSEDRWAHVTLAEVHRACSKATKRHGRPMSRPIVIAIEDSTAQTRPPHDHQNDLAVRRRSWTPTRALRLRRGRRTTRSLRRAGWGPRGSEGLRRQQAIALSQIDPASSSSSSGAATTATRRMTGRLQ